MRNLKGTKTEENLINAIAGESVARNKYTYFEEKARADGYEQIADIFKATADNEKEHAKIWYKLLNGGKIGLVDENLQSAAEGEHYEWTETYKEFARVAKEEGFNDIAFLFEQVANIEKEHEERFNKLLENVKNNKVFAKDDQVIWICGNCGHIVVGNKAPEVCPVCSHPQAYFELKSENY